MALNIPGVFVTGTDTDVGKTFISAIIARQLTSEGLKVGVYKPACSGAVDEGSGPVWEDVEVLHAATGKAFDRDRISPQRFRAALAPPIAARDEGRCVDAELLRSGAMWWEGRCDFLIVEGVGGWLCPLTDSESVADLAVEFGLPLLIVARATLGTINHTLLTVESAQARNCRFAGVVLNHGAVNVDARSAMTNAAEISRRITVPVIATIPHCLPGVESQAKIDWLKFINDALDP